MDIFGDGADGVWERVRFACLLRTRNPRLAVRFDGDDLFQEVRACAASGRAQFTGTTEQELEAWLSAVVRSRFCDLYDRHARSQKRAVGKEAAQSHFEESSRCLMRSVAGDATSAGSAVARNERAEAVHRAVNELPEPDRTAVVMKMFYGATLKEIGTALGTDISGADRAVRRALARLRTLLDAHRE